MLAPSQRTPVELAAALNSQSINALTVLALSVGTLNGSAPGATGLELLEAITAEEAKATLVLDNFASTITTDVVTLTGSTTAPRSITMPDANVDLGQIPIDKVEGGSNLVNANAVTLSDGSGGLIESLAFIDTNSNATGFNSIRLATAPTTVPVAGGTLSWNGTEGVPEFQLEVGGVVWQGPLEALHFVYNNTGVQIDNCSPLYPTGVVNGGVPEVGLAEADALGADVRKRRCEYISTMDIPHGSSGFAVSRGFGRGCNTDAYSAGDDFYLGNGGGVATTRPDLPSSQIRLAQVLVSHLTAGVINVRVTDLSWVGAVQSNVRAFERTGFTLKTGRPVDSADNVITLSHDDVTRTLTINAASGFFDFYNQDNQRFKPSGESVQWTNVEGSHYIYYDSAGTLLHRESFDDALIREDWTFVAEVVWDADNEETLLGGPIVEMHGHQTAGSTHLICHRFIGAQIIGDGCGLTDIVTGAGGTLAAHAQFGVAAGLLGDEDLEHPIAQVTSTTGYRILYSEGAAATTTRQFVKASFPLMTVTDAGIGATDQPVFNEFTGGVWQLSAVPNNEYFWAFPYVIGTGSTGDTTYVRMGTQTYASLADAEDDVDNEISASLDAIPFEEKRILGGVLFRYRSIYSNGVLSTIYSAFGQDYYDLRRSSVTGVGGAAATSHNALTGRDDAGAHALLRAPTLADQVIQLADAAATYGLSITDSLGVEVARVDSDGNITATSLTSSGNLLAGANTDLQAVVGRARIDSRAADIAYFSHYDQSGAADFAFAQVAAGGTFFNAPSGQVGTFQIAGVAKALWSATTFELTNIDLDTNGNDIDLGGGDVLDGGAINGATGGFSGDVTVGDGTSNTLLVVDGGAGLVRDLRFRSTGVERWLFRCNADAESGSNAGSNFEIVRRSDAGANLGAAFQIIRATGDVNIFGDTYLNGNDIDLGGGDITDSTGSVTVADALVVEDGLTVGDTATATMQAYILSTSSGAINFGDLADDNVGNITYSHSANEMTLTVGAGPCITLTSDGLKLEAARALQFTGSGGDPSSPSDGDMWHRFDTDQLRVRLNGTTYSVDVTAV